MGQRGEHGAAQRPTAIMGDPVADGGGTSSAAVGDKVPGAPATGDMPSAEGRATKRSRRFVVIALSVVVAVAIVCASLVVFTLQTGKRELQAGSNEASLMTFTRDGQTYRYNPAMVSVLFLGVDKENGRLVAPYNGQADAIHLLAIDTSTGKITCISFSRNAMVSYPHVDPSTRESLGVREDYLCLAYSYGADDPDSGQRMCKVVSEVLGGIPVNAYYILNLSGIGALSEAVGGVELVPTRDIPGTDIREGQPVTLLGADAQAYVQWRDESDDYSSLRRLERQQEFASAFAAQALKMAKGDPLTLWRFFGAAEGSSCTNLDFPEVAYLASLLVGGSASGVEMVNLPGDVVMFDDRMNGYRFDAAGVRDVMLDTFFIAE